jgi:prevent-host-death family protein
MHVRVTVHAAKTNLSRLIAAAEAGEEVVILRGSVPAVRLVPVGEAAPVRRFGALAGRIALDDSFFEPLPPAELEAWEG